jgi:hypothetical protein
MRQDASLPARQKLSLTDGFSPAILDAMSSEFETLHNQKTGAVVDPLNLALLALDKPKAVRRAPLKGGGTRAAKATAVSPARLANGYELRNAVDFAVYIARHPQLTDFLQASHQELRRLFGPEPKFVLEIVRDPEASAPSDFLFVNIRTSMPVDEAMARLDQFDDGWYLDQLDGFGELVNFNLEFYDL